MSSRIQTTALFVIALSTLMFTALNVGAQDPVPASDAALLIGPGDLVQVSVLGAPDYQRDVRVSDSGQVTLPMIGAVPLSKLSVADAERLVAKRLSDGGFFTDPQVSVLVKEYATQGISVLGEVQKPGVYPLLGPRRLFDAISLAGGLTPKAGRKVVITRRKDPAHPESVDLGPDPANSSSANVDVLPGDTVAVSKAGIVYVVGDVRLPGGFVIDRGDITVLQALALAQGPNSTAALNAARVIRGNGDQHQETPIQLKKILQAKLPDITLKPDDILFVPNSMGKSAARRGFEAALQAAVGAAIYRP